MNFSCNKRNLVICAYLGSVFCGVGGVATPVAAQNAAAPAQCPPGSVTASTTQAADPVAEEAIRKRVQAALHSDRYFYDEHVTVSVEGGDVVLRGFVFSDWDLLDAIHIARKAACHRRVIDNLSIKVGGRK
jgi:hypothetical protein